LPRGPLAKPDDSMRIDAELQKLIDHLNQDRPAAIGK
jgi:hypothetical protein